MAKDSNWYVQIKADKGKAPYQRSPDDGGFEIRIKQREKGGSKEVVFLEGVVNDDGTLGLYLITPDMPKGVKQELALTER